MHVRVWRDGEWWHATLAYRGASYFLGSARERRTVWAYVRESVEWLLGWEEIDRG